MQGRPGAAEEADEVKRVLREWSGGRVATGVALVRLIGATGDPEGARRALEGSIDGAQGSAARALLDGLIRNERSVATAGRLLARARRELDAAPPAEALARARDFFDWAVAEDPGLAVAAYALEGPAAIDAATCEIVAQLDGRGLLGADRVALDLGCGAGRLVLALSVRCARVTGVDVSPAMIAHARRVCGSSPRVCLLEHDGRDLRRFAEATFDLVVAVDVFPYLVQQGSAQAHLADAGRILRPGGDVVIFNWSYRGDDALDASEVRSACARGGLELLSDGERQLAGWDAALYHARRPPG